MTVPVEVERTNLENLATVLAYAQSVDVVTNALLAFPGVLVEGVKLLFHLSSARSLLRLNPRIGASPAELAVYRLNVTRRAGYLSAASRRLSAAFVRGTDEAQKALRTELRYLMSHLAAEQRRVEAAEQVAVKVRVQQRQARKTGTPWPGLLGWYTTLDSRTSPECRRANGRNFDPRKVPAIGFPGAVHLHCRCRPGPPHATDLRVERVRPDHTRRLYPQPQRVVI